MTDASPSEPTPPGTIPADDPTRVLTHASPDTDESLEHLNYRTELLLDGPGA